MRPALLNPLFAPVTALAGIAGKSAKLLDKLVRRDGGARVLDLLFHLPSGVVDRRARPRLSEVVPDTVVTVEVVIDGHRRPPPHRPRAPYLVHASDGTGSLVITYFSARREHIEKLLPVGERRYVSGTAKFYEGTLQMVHPERVADAATFAAMAPVEPLYPLTEGLTQNAARRATAAALEALPELPEWLEATRLAHAGWPDAATALAALHRPRDTGDVAPDGAAWSRLAYDELFASQLALGLIRRHLHRTRVRRQQATRATSSRPGRAGLEARLRAALPFRLTGSQERAIADIASDLARPERMVRLLQGDVGSGKTLVALFAAAAAVAAGGQAALMAPTEVLARQHLRTIAPLAAAAGMTVGVITGRERGDARKALLAGVANGGIDLVIGTHALYSDDVAFAGLTLAVIDEQHRFGVHQRLALAAKGAAVDLLVMTATPIPRTLVLTSFGDMDLSELRDKPPGREPVDTRVMPLDRLEEVTSGVGRAVAAGRRVYWVCPLVEESENSDLAAAEARFADLSHRFGDAVALVHGRQKGAVKDAAMARFVAGDARILIATTVIEVGVDVPEASVMVVEHADRFGLSQLHQLRGRIGRGSGQRSSCILLYRQPLAHTARARLSIMRDSEDGFRIAEEDLRLRGEGDLLGTRQSGLPGFRVADPVVHRDLLEAARDEAAGVLSRDPDLTGERGDALRVLLYLFERDEAVRLIAAG